MGVNLSYKVWDEGGSDPVEGHSFAFGVRLVSSLIVIATFFGLFVRPLLGLLVPLVPLLFLGFNFEVLLLLCLELGLLNTLESVKPLAQFFLKLALLGDHSVDVDLVFFRWLLSFLRWDVAVWSIVLDGD